MTLQPRLYNRCPVFCVFPGVGKTTLAKLKPEGVVEIHRPDLRGSSAYIELIEAARDSDKAVLVPSYPWLIDALQSAGIPTALVYPTKALKAHYLDRYRAMGSSVEYITGMERAFESAIDQLTRRTQGTRHIQLDGPDQYLSDVDFFKVFDRAVL